MDVTGTDPRTRAGLFLWPWAATGYSNMSTNVANGVASTTAQSVPNAPAASLGLPHVPQMTAPGMFGAAAGPGNSQPTDDAFESFYSRLSYSTGVHSSHMSSLQQQMQQREQRTCEAPNSDMQGTRVSMIQGQQSLQQQHRQQQQQQQTSGSLSGLHRGEQQQQGPFADQRLMNGMMHRPSQQQAAAAIAAIASAAASRNSAAAAAVAASAPTANSASSSPLNSGAFHNPPLSPQGPPISLHQQQHSHLGHPLQQQQQQQQQQQRPYSSTGSLHNVSTTVPSSPLDGRMSSSASPSVSSASAAGNYCLKRHPPNDFNSATAMALAVAVAAGDRHAQMQQQQQQQELGGGVVGSRSPPDQLHHALGGHIASTADVFSAATGPGQTPAQYLFPPSSPMKSFYRRPSEAAAMAAAMAAQAARDASGGMNVHAGGSGVGGGGGDRSMSMAAHQRLLGGHGGFLLSNMGAAAAAAAAVSSSAHSPLDRVPDFLSDMRLGQETPVSGSGGPLQQGGPGSNQSIGQSHSGGLGSETALDTLPSLYGHAAKGYKCKICQHVCFSRQDLSTHNSTTHKQDPRPYRCDQCGRQFSTCAYLSQHRRIHSGIKPYVCRYCDRKFTQLSHVQQHERIHTGEKPYKCVTCFKSFTQMSNLQSHQRQHMKGKPHRCENCFMSYDTKEDLDLHVQAKHAGNRYAKVLVCPACSKSYNSETYLSKHMERHKEAVTNSSVGRLGLNSSGALGALSGFVNPGRGRSGSTGDLHDEIQHYPELHHLQHAAAAAAAASFMPHSESSLLHHLPPGLQGQNAAHLVAAAAAHKSEQQAGQQGHHTAGGGGLIEQSQHHVSPSSSSSGRMSVGHTPYPQQQQHHQHHHQQILAAAAASHHLASSYAGTGQMPAFLNKPPSLEECMNAEELVASGLRHVARFSDSKTGFQSLAAAAVVTSPTPQPPPIAHQQTRGGQMIGDPSPRQQDNFQQYCRSPAEDQHHPQQHTDSADSLDGRSQSPGFRGPPKETGIGDKRVRKPPLEAWEQHVVSGGQMPESARINSMESSATGTVTGSTSSHLGADEAVGCRSLGFYSHLSAAKRLKPDPDELEEEEDNPRHLTVSDQKDCSRAGKRISLDETSAVSGGSSSSSSSNHQRNFGTEFLRRSAPNSASSCTADTLFHSRSHQEYNPQRQQQQHHHHPQQQQQQQQQHQMTNLPQETMTHTVENVVDKLAKFFPLVGAGGADKRNVNTSVRDLRIEALLAGFQGQAQDARGVLPGTNDEEDEDDEADEEEEEEEIEEERRTKLSTGHLAHASRTDKGSGSQLSSSYRSESVSTTAKIPAVASSPSMEDFRTSSQQPVGQSARAFMEEDIRNERSHGSVQKVPGSINFVQRQSSVVGGSPSPVPPSSSPVYSTEESRYGRGLQGQANGQFFQRSGFFESSKLSDTGSGSQTYDPTNSTPSTPPPPTTKESDENSFCEALGHRHVPFGHSGKLGLTVHGSPLARDLSGKSAESSLEEQQQQQQQQDQQQQQSRSRGGINFLSFPDQ